MDFRYAIRQLRENPGFASTPILTLALGIRGQRCLVDAALIQSLPSVDTVILGEVIWLARAGNTLGVFCSIAVATVMRGLLFGVDSWHVPTLAGAVAVSRYFPRRPALVNPIEALRAE